jgi:hypothetical protein
MPNRITVFSSNRKPRYKVRTDRRSLARSPFPDVFAPALPAEFSDTIRVVGLLSAAEASAWGARRAAMLIDAANRSAVAMVSGGFLAAAIREMPGSKVAA